MLLVISAVSVSMLYNAHRMGLEQFGSEVSADFSVLEMKRQNILTGIDRFSSGSTLPGRWKRISPDSSARPRKNTCSIT